jgi:hypothetical protein
MIIAQGDRLREIVARSRFLDGEFEVRTGVAAEEELESNRPRAAFRSSGNQGEIYLATEHPFRMACWLSKLHLLRTGS